MTSTNNKNIHPVKDFFLMHKLFENKLNDYFQSKKGREIIKEYITLIKKNPILQQEYVACNTILSANWNPKLTEEAISSFPYISKETLIEENKKVENFINEKKIGSVDDVKASVNPLLVGLSESVSYLITHKNNLYNVGKRMECISSISKYIEENAKKNEESVLQESERKVENLEEYFTSLIEEFNKKYDGILDEEKKKVTSDLIGTMKEDDSVKEKLYNSYRKETLASVNPLIQENKGELKEKLLSLKESILNKEYSAETFVDDIIDFVTIKNQLQN